NGFNDYRTPSPKIKTSNQKVGVLEEGETFAIIVPKGSIKVKEVPTSPDCSYLELTQGVLEIKKLLDKSEIARFGNLAELREEHQNTPGTSQTIIREGEEQIFDLTKIGGFSSKVISNFDCLIKKADYFNSELVTFQNKEFYEDITKDREIHIQNTKKISNCKREFRENFTKFQESVQSSNSSIFSLFRPGIPKDLEISSRELKNLFYDLEIAKSTQFRLEINQQITNLHDHYTQEKQEYNQLIQAGESALKLKNQELSSKEREKEELERLGREQLNKKESEKQAIQTEKEQLQNQIQLLQEQIRTITLNYQQVARKCQAYEEIE
ncbi:4806_t:CDS:2, partial [Racocetra fulgida]